MKDIVFGDGQIGNPGEMLRFAGLAVLFPVLDKGDPFILMRLVERRVVNDTKTVG